MTKPAITAYITNFNYGKYLEQSINSVLCQRFTDFELIIIDDGSTDNSSEILDKYRDHPKISIIQQKNQGLNASANKALDMAAGDFLIRLDADDYLDQYAFMILHDAITEKQNTNLVFADYYYINQVGDVIGQERRFNFAKDVSLYDCPAHGACSLIRVKTLREIGGYSKEFLCQDGYDLWLKMLKVGGIVNVNLPLFFYRQHGSNLTRSTEKILKTRAKIKKKHARSSIKNQKNTMAVIPVRGSLYDKNCIAEKPLIDRPLLHYTIDASLLAESIQKTIITSPDKRLLQNVKEVYGDKIHCDLRDEDSASPLMSLNSTINRIWRDEANKENYENLVILSPETPFRTNAHIDEAVDTLLIHNLDFVFPVMPEKDLLYKHDGTSLKKISNDTETNTMRFERDYVYRKISGLTVTNAAHFLSKSGEFVGKIGHIEYDKQTAFRIETSEDFVIAAEIQKRIMERKND